MSTYDIPYLVDGLQIVVIGLGIYAVPEIVSLLREDQAIAKGAPLGSGWLQGMRDWWNNKWLSTKCAVIGVVVGIIPGLGGSVVDWIAYGYTVQSSREKGEFGKGDIRDPDLNAYWQDLSLIVSGPIWSSERWAAIWRMHTGANNHLLDAYLQNHPQKPAR